MVTWTTTEETVTWTAVDDPSVTWAVNVNPTVTGGGGSGDVVGPASVTADRPAVFNGTTGKLLKQGSAVGASLVSAADAAAARTALGLGTAATSATGDFATPASVTAAVDDVTPVLCNFALATSAVDGTATSFQIVVPDPKGTASGVVPVGWRSTFSIPDVATLQGLLTGQGITTATVLVASEPGVYQFTPDTIDDPWTDITPADGVDVYAGPASSHTHCWFDAGTLRYLSGATIPYTGDGLLTGTYTVSDAVENIEGIIDTERWVCAYFDTTNVTIANYDGPSDVVTQPTPDGGIMVEGADVLVIAQTDPTENGIYRIASPSGIWTKLDYPDVLIGNSFMVMVNAEGDAADGTHFEWVDEDPTIPQRRSIAYLGSSDGFGDGRNGRWIKYAPAGTGGTVDAVSNVAQDRILGRVSSGSGDSEELTAAQVRTFIGNPVLGGQDEGPVVTATSAATLLDAVIPLTGATGDHFTVTIGGRFNNQSGSAKRPTITVLLGATTVCTLVPASTIASNAADRLFRATIDIRVNGATDINAVGDGQIVASVFSVSTGTASGDITAGLNLDIQGAVESGGSQEVQLTQVTVMRLRA